MQADPPKATPAQRAAFGTDEPPAEAIRLPLGPFAVRVADGHIRSIHCGRHEIVRGLTYLLRDRDWATAGAATALSVDGPDRATVTGEIDDGAIRFSYALTMQLEPDGALVVRSEGVARSAFQANRVGLTVLHPVPETVGVPLRVRHADGTESESAFPVEIRPSQPIFDIAAMSYPLSPAERVSIALGSIRPDGSSQAFEMEDQRNWGDASYKTYVGSLREPWPFEVSEGDRFRQEVRIEVVRSAAAGSRPAAPALPPQRTFSLPRVGIAIPDGGAREALSNIARFGPVAPAFVSAYLRSDALDPAGLAAVAEVAGTLSCPLRLELQVDGEPAAALDAVARAMDGAGASAAGILACPAAYLKSYQPDGDWPDILPLGDFYALVRDRFPEAEIGGGMLTYFTELNRKWPPLEAIDFIGHGYCPIVHAADDETVLQNVGTLAMMADTVNRAAPGKPYDLISARLSMRQNPYGAAPVANPDNRRIAMAAADPREDGEFAGIWMIAVARALARTHARSLCIGALAGPASIYSAAAADGRRPSFHAFETLAALAGADGERFERETARLIDDRFPHARAELSGLVD